MRVHPSTPIVVTGQGIPSFLWLLFLLLLCSSGFAQSRQEAPPLPVTAAPAAAWLLACSLALLCAALALFSLRREREIAHV
jgi:hypothetical protein